MGKKKHLKPGGGAKPSGQKVRSEGSHKARYQSSMNRYAGGKSMHNLQYQMKKEKQEKFKNHKSAALREYAKLCKREGIESERVNLGPREDKKKSEEGSSREDKNKPKKRTVIPFYKEQKQAEQAQEERAKQEGERGTVEMEIAAKKKARLERNKDRMKRTKRGQPLLDNTMRRLLETIKQNA